MLLETLVSGGLIPILSESLSFINDELLGVQELCYFVRKLVTVSENCEIMQNVFS